MNPNQPQQTPIAQLRTANPGNAPKNMPKSAKKGINQSKPSNPNSTQNSLQIAEIRDGIAIMNDGSFRAVIRTKAINFDLMSTSEREGVEYSYQGFLNSLYFPIQIFVRSQKVDIKPYIDRLDKIRSEHDNMLLSLLMEDYIDFMSNIASQTNIMDKKFYVVVPYYNEVTTQKLKNAGRSFFGNIFGKDNSQKTIMVNEGDLEKAKTELRNRIQATLSGLAQCGVSGTPLDTQELIELYYSSYNPETATRQPLQNIEDLTAPVITKGVGQAPKTSLESSGY
jgi:hypothetical protein